ncbi:MAG: hypothetical protein ACXADY_06080 [Candidatus Hodarchaeales archaeon]|jgi:hypothetical protein
MRGKIIDVVNRIDDFESHIEDIPLNLKLHPSERDYSNITSSNKKYCTSIYHRGWQLKTQTLYAQYIWFEQFESNVVSKMDPSHFDKSGNLIEDSNGILNVKSVKITMVIER